MAKPIESYHYTSCFTCRDAKKFALGKGVELKERDFFKDQFTEAELRKLLKSRVSEGWPSKSPYVKVLGLADKKLSDDQMIQWMLKEPRLIKRPVELEKVLHS